MEAFIVEILSKVFEMDMVCGKWDRKKMIRNIKDIIVWIRNLDMANILGLMDGFIKETFRMTIETVMGNFLMAILACIRDIGLMDNKLKATHNLIHQKLQIILEERVKVEKKFTLM